MHVIATFLATFSCKIAYPFVFIPSDCNMFSFHPLKGISSSFSESFGILYACFIILKPSESLGPTKEKFLRCHLLLPAALV